MKSCTKCGAFNSNLAAVCGVCGAPAALLQASAPPPPRSIPARPWASREVGREADIMFVLDCTESMCGELDAIRDAILSFAETIRTEGVRARVGLIAFRDRLIGEEQRVLDFQGEPFTADPEAFRCAVARLRATGGGDIPESSFDALLLALRQPFRSTAAKVVVLVTDAPPHLPDRETRSLAEVKHALHRADLQQLYLVIRISDAASAVYLQLLEETSGVAFDLGADDDFRRRAEDFKRTLMSLGRTISATTSAAATD